MRLSEVVKFTETDSRMMVARHFREGRRRSYCFLNTEFQLGKMKEVLEVGDGDGVLAAQHVNVLNATELHT